MKIKGITEIGESRNTRIGEMKVIDRTMVRHRNGKIFIRYLYEGMLEKLAEDMRKNIVDDKDNVIIVEGPERSGKSNMAYWGCKTFDPDFDMRMNYIYDFDKFVEIIADRDIRNETFWLDEMSNLANNRDWNSTDNKPLVEFFEMMGSKQINFFGCIPHHERLDVYIRENRIRYLITCQPFAFDIRGLVRRGIFELQKIDDYGKLQHVGYGTYPKIPDEDKEIYESIKFESQQKKIEEIVARGKDKNGSKYKKMYEERCKKERDIMLKMSESGIDSDHIMGLFGYSDKQQYYNMITKARKEREA